MNLTEDALLKSETLPLSAVMLHCETVSSCFLLEEPVNKQSYIITAIKNLTHTNRNTTQDIDLSVIFNIVYTHYA